MESGFKIQWLLDPIHDESRGLGFFFFQETSSLPLVVQKQTYICLVCESPYILCEVHLPARAHCV